MKDRILGRYIAKNHSDNVFTDRELQVIKQGDTDTLVETFLHMDKDYYKTQMQCTLKRLGMFMDCNIELNQIDYEREYKGQFDGLKMCYIGDGNNMANSLIVGGLTVGMEVSAACPEGYHPDKTVLDFAKIYEGKFTLTADPVEAAANADVIFTDVWASMGQEGEAAERRKVFEGIYQINDNVMAAAKRDAMVQHCLPAHREEEITAKVFEAHAEEIFDEAENRLHAQKAVMVKLMKN